MSVSIADHPLDKQAVTAYPIHELLCNRWSPRMFDSRPVDLTTLGSLLEAARWSPSSRNEQPWRFVLATQQDREAFERILSVLNESNQRWAKDAPVLFIGVAKSTFDHNGNQNAYAWYDLGQALAHLSVQATAAGLHLHQMGGFNKELARERLHIPADHEPVVAVALGYLGDLSQLPEDLRQRESAARTRKPLQTLVFEGEWSNPLFAE